jgi:hypothetical protein
MGSLLLAAGELLHTAFDASSRPPGEKGHRHVLPNATVMIHRTPLLYLTIFI